MATELLFMPVMAVANDFNDKEKKSESNFPGAHFQPNYFSFIMWVVFIIFAVQYFSKNAAKETISYSEFLQFVDKGQVENLVLAENVIAGEIKDEGKPSKFFSTVAAPEDKTLIEKLHAKEIKFRA